MELPDKLYFKIGEVAKIVGVRQHVLRYWETEFSTVRPQKTVSNQRLYRRRDVEALLAIKHLLYEKKFTIEGARNHLKKEGLGPSLPGPDPAEIAQKARTDAWAEASDEALRERARMGAQYQKDLLVLRQEISSFLKSLDEENAEKAPA